MRLTPAYDRKDELWGPIATPERDAMEAQLKEEIHSYFVGEAIKRERMKQNLSQEELGNRIGVKRAQICKLENGKGSMTITTMGRVFKALGVSNACLDLGVAGKVPRW